MKQMITLQWFKTYIFEIWICFPFQTVKSDLCKILCVLSKFEYLEINQKICKKERKGSASEQWQTKGGILRVAQAEQTQLLPFLAADYSSSLREGGNPSGESGKPTLTLKPFLLSVVTNRRARWQLSQWSWYETITCFKTKRDEAEQAWKTCTRRKITVWGVIDSCHCKTEVWMVATFLSVSLHYANPLLRKFSVI